MGSDLMTRRILILFGAMCAASLLWNFSTFRQISDIGAASERSLLQWRNVDQKQDMNAISVSISKTRNRRFPLENCGNTSKTPKSAFDDMIAIPMMSTYMETQTDVMIHRARLVTEQLAHHGLRTRFISGAVGHHNVHDYYYSEWR